MTNEFFNGFRMGDYQRENFDDFLENISFSFNIPSVHIAGTNGKGTTAFFLCNIFKNAGYKVGLFSSPYLYEINEQTKVDNVAISDEEFLEIFNEYKKEISKFNLSAFEVQTFVSFKYFEKKNCDICIIECGMGGELDATNIFTPILSIITSIGLEHTSFLGKTVAEIAYSKGGIIKDYVPVLIGNMNQEAENVIIELCKVHKSKLSKTFDPCRLVLNEEGYTFTYSDFENVHIKSSTDYAVFDACLALEAMRILSNEYAISKDTIISSFLVEHLPARFSIIGENKRTIIDGAHNPEAAAQLKQEIANYCKEIPVHTLFCCFKDKNLPALLSSLGEVSSDLILTTFDNPRARQEMDYFLFLGDYQYKDDAFSAYQELRNLYPDDYILITGSLAFAGYMLKKIGG